MGTSSITPCYDVERLETKTHVGLVPGESIEYIKHRVSLEGHPWPGCCPGSDTWHPYSYGQTKQKRDLNNVGQVNPKRLPFKQKGLWSARQGHPGCKTLQMWTARTSQLPNKCLKWTMPKTRRCLWWNGLGPMGHCNPEEEYANVIASTNHLEILCFVTGPPLAQLPKPTKSCSDFLYEAERSMYILKALTGQSRDSWLPVGGGNAESVITWALNGVENTLGT